MEVMATWDKELYGEEGPGYATDGAAAFDLKVKKFQFLDDKRMFMEIDVGLALAIPHGYFGLLALRSSMPLRGGILLGNAVGIIDSDYRGDIKLRVARIDGKPFCEGGWQPEYGMRIAQLVILPYMKVDLAFTEKLPITKRGKGGFGSTGK